MLNRLNGDSELIVMTAGGMPAWSLLKPLGAAGACWYRSASASSTTWPVPGHSSKLRELAVQVRTDLMAQVIQPWRFTSPEAKLTVHIRDRAPNGELLGLVMHDARDPKQVVTYLAERGRIIKQGDAAYLRMEKGHIVRRLENDASPQIIVFERYAVDINQLEQRADQVVVRAPARALHGRAPAPRSERSRLQDESRAASPPSCTSAWPAPSMRSPLC